MDKVVASPDEAVADIPDGATLAITGFGRWHRFPRSLTAAVADKGVRDLEIACLVLDPANGSRGGYGLVGNGQVRRLIAAFASRAGERSAVDEKIYSGELEVEMVSMGVLVERLRAGGSQIPAFYTRTGVGTELAAGKEIREFDGVEYVLEKGLRVDFRVPPGVARRQGGQRPVPRCEPEHQPGVRQGRPDRDRGGAGDRRGRLDRPGGRRPARDLRRPRRAQHRAGDVRSASAWCCRAGIPRPARPIWASRH